MEVNIKLKSEKVNSDIVRIDLYISNKLVGTILEQSNMGTTGNPLKYALIDTYNDILFSTMEE